MQNFFFVSVFFALSQKMFDMGFQPQIEKIVRNIRPNHQTLMFSATFPRTIEASGEDAKTLCAVVVVFVFVLISLFCFCFDN